MKIIFKVDGKNLFVEQDAKVVPRDGWRVKWSGMWFVAVGFPSIDYDLAKEDECVEVELAKENQQAIPGSKKVRCIKVWKQNRNNLTVDKLYTVIREKTGRHKDSFTIVDDNGKEKTYFTDNTQFHGLREE